MDNIVGSASIIIRPDMAGFEAEMEAASAPGLSGFQKKAETAGKQGGEKLSKGFKGGTGGITSALGALGVPLQTFGGRLDKTAASLANVETHGSKLGSTLANIGGTALLGTTVAFVAAGAAGVDLAMKYEEVTAKIAAAGDMSTASAKKITDAFLGTAGSTIYSAKEIGTAYAGVAGELGTVEGHALKTGEAMQFMTAAQHLAEGSGGQLGSVTEVLGKTLLVYHLAATQAASASDVLFEASRQTGMSVESLAQIVDRARGRLGALAPSLNETAGLVALLSKQGVAGRQAMSALNGTFTTLTSGGKKTEEMAKALGLQIFDNNGKFVGLTSVITQLQPKLANLSQEQQLAATKALFGASASKQLLQVILQGPAAYEASVAAVSKHGAAEEAARKQGETLQAQLKTLKAAAEDLAIKIGQVLIPKLTEFVKSLGEGINWLKKHEAAAIALGVVITTVLGAAIGAFVATKVAAFVGGMKTMIGGIVALGTKMAAWLVPSMAESGAAIVAGSETTAAGVDAALMGTGIGATLVLLGAAAYLLSENWETVMVAMEKATETAANAMIDLLNAVKEAIEDTASLGLIPLAQELGLIHGSVIPNIPHVTEAAENAAESAAEREQAGANKQDEEGMREKGKGGLSEKGGSMMAFFEAKGLSRAQAAGIVGSTMQESALNPNEVGGGLFQDEGGRGAGKGASALKQMEKAWQEMQVPGSKEHAALEELRKTHSAAEAARVFSGSAASGKGFERPGTPEIAKREQYAKEALAAHPAAAGKHAAATERDTTVIGKHSAATEAAIKAAGEHTKATKAHHASTMASAASIDKWAEGAVGKFTETGGKHRGPELDKLQAEFHTKAAAWCAEFATTAAMMGGANKAVRTASVATIREWAQQGSHGYQKGVSSTPRTGALMMFGDQHVGFVQSVNKAAGTVNTIEGNVGAGGVRRETHKISEGDYAMPAYKKVEVGGVELQRMSKAFLEAGKVEEKKRTADAKAGEAAKTKLIAAISSGGVKELTKVVGGSHDKALALLEKQLHGDHVAALDKLSKALVDAHKKALAALQVALVKVAEKAAATRMGREDVIHTDEADAAATAIGDATKVALDHAAEAGTTGAELIARQAQSHLDELKAADDASVAAAKLAVDRVAGTGEAAEATAKQQLVNAENTQKVQEAAATQALDLANNAASEAEKQKAADEKQRKEEEETAKERKKLAEEEAKKTGGAASPVGNFTFYINGANMTPAEIMAETGWALRTGTLPVAPPGPAHAPVGVA